ncbi:endonuclease/exonuclease/phosphatase family protein [Pseudomonas viridiflava]
MEGSDAEKTDRNTLTFAWWNTSLAPTSVSKSTPELQDFAAQVLEYLIVDKGADFIALGEVSQLDFDILSSKSSFAHYQYVSAVAAVGRTSFDLGYLYNKLKISVIDAKNISTMSGTSTLKLAHRVIIEVAGSILPICLFISHWPSRMYTSSNDSTRHELGVRLRSKVDEVLEVEGANPLVILLGDFNDEPFDLSMSEQLKASRDIELVKRKPHLLYNPFWSYLGRKNSHKLSTGSYFYKGGKVTKWHTFDQIIFSHGFIKATHWRLAEDCEYIVQLPELVEMVKSRKSVFDHLPVYGIIEQVA